MASSSFYSKPRAKRPSAEDAVAGRLAKRLASAERHCRSSSEVPQRGKVSSAAGSRERLLVPRKSWKFFSRQQPAIDFARSSPSNLHVFSFEDPLLGGHGRRRFLVSSYLQFYSWYKSTKKLERTFYEVIPEGCVCRLYFDLEYATEHNPGRGGDRRVEIFVQAVCFYVRQEFNVECRADHVLDLDSSTDKKFSRHLIFHLENCCFQNNVEAGHFVQYACADLLRRIKSSEPLGTQVPASTLQQLIIRKADGAEDLFCDQGVYTRNRNFRLLGSSKLGKSAYLSVADQSRFMYQDVDRARDSLNTDLLGTLDANQYALFRASLVCAVSFSPNSNPRVLTFRPGTSQSPLLYSADTRSATDTIHKQAGGCDHGNSSNPISSASFSPSPFPDVDRFILNMLPHRSHDNVPGVIRKWFYFSEGKTLSYDIGGNRWCQNVGRHHKSNHIMIVVDLAANTFYQKCHDPDCRRSGYRSAESPLPGHLVKSHGIEQEGSSFVQEGELSGAELEEVLSMLELTDVYVDHFWDDDDVIGASNISGSTGVTTTSATISTDSTTASTTTSTSAATSTSFIASSSPPTTATVPSEDSESDRQRRIQGGDDIIDDLLYDALFDDDINEAEVSVETTAATCGSTTSPTATSEDHVGYDSGETCDSTCCVVTVAPPQCRSSERPATTCGIAPMATIDGYVGHDHDDTIVSASGFVGTVDSSEHLPLRRAADADGCDDADLSVLGLDRHSYSQLFDAAQDTIM